MILKDRATVKRQKATGDTSPSGIPLTSYESIYTSLKASFQSDSTNLAPAAVGQTVIKKVTVFLPTSYYDQDSKTTVDVDIQEKDILIDEATQTKYRVMEARPFRNLLPHWEVKAESGVV